MKLSRVSMLSQYTFADPNRIALKSGEGLGLLRCSGEAIGPAGARVDLGLTGCFTNGRACTGPKLLELVEPLTVP